MVLYLQMSYSKGEQTTTGEVGWQDGRERRMAEWFWIPVVFIAFIGIMALIGFMDNWHKKSEYKIYRKEREEIYKQEAEAVKRFHEYEASVIDRRTD